MIAKYENGKIYGIRNGETTLKAFAGDISYEVPIEVSLQKGYLARQNNGYNLIYKTSAKTLYDYSLNTFSVTASSTFNYNVVFENLNNTYRNMQANTYFKVIKNQYEKLGCSVDYTSGNASNITIEKIKYRKFDLKYTLKYNNSSIGIIQQQYIVSNKENTYIVTFTTSNNNDNSYEIEKVMKAFYLL